MTVAVPVLERQYVSFGTIKLCAFGTPCRFVSSNQTVFSHENACRQLDNFCLTLWSVIYPTGLQKAGSNQKLNTKWFCIFAAVSFTYLFRCTWLLLQLITLSDTLGSIPLDEGSALCRDPYLITHKIRKRQQFHGRIRTNDPSKRSAADHIPRGHQIYQVFYFSINTQIAFAHSVQI